LQRKAVGRMLQDWERQYPGRSETMFRALGNVAPSQLADRKLFDFAALGSREGARRADVHGWLAGSESENG
jgi:tRNA 2-thiocytidine biosynthesis protein TtcA